MFGDKKKITDSERSLISETVSIEGTINSSGAIDVAGLVKGPVYSKEIIVRETLDEDISGLFKILNNKENQKLVGGSLKSMSLQEVGDWLQAKRADHQTVIFSILKGEEFAGYIIITSIDLINGHAILV